MRSSGSRRFATAVTGTTTEPVPFAPATATVTLFEPGAMIHSGARYHPPLPAADFAMSGGGVPAVASKRFTTAVT